MAILKEIPSKLSESIKVNYWTLGHLEGFETENNTKVKVRFRLDGYVSEQDHKDCKPSIDDKHSEIVLEKSEIPVWAMIYDIAKEKILELADGENLLVNTVVEEVVEEPVAEVVEEEVVV